MFRGKLYGIACIDSNNGIGYQNNLLVRNKEDMKWFTSMTNDNYCVMGSNTFKSIPNHEMGLPNRTCIVLSSDPEFLKNNTGDDMRSQVILVNSMDELHKTINNLLNNEQDVFICGGESIYKEFINEMDILLLTEIDDEYVADKYFPEFNKNDYWYSTLKEFTIKNPYDNSEKIAKIVIYNRKE